MARLRLVETRHAIGMAVAALWWGMAACANSPVEVVFQVIEEVEFDPALNVDLSQMTVTNNGIYWQDLAVGTGDTLVFGASATVDYTGWLVDGTQFDTGTGFVFTMGFNQVIRGWEDGMLGMLAGGSRKLVIPPELAYGGLARPGIPPGSILVFDVAVTSVTPAAGQ